MNSGERFGLINQTMDETMITENEQPSFIEEAAPRGKMGTITDSNNTGNFETCKFNQGKDKLDFDDATDQIIKEEGDIPDLNKDDDMSFASKKSIENMSAA